MSEIVTLRYVNGKYVRESEYVPVRSRYHVDHSWTTSRELPSGRLRIVAYSPYGRVSWSTHWQETRSASLRSRLRTIIEEIEAAANDLVPKLEVAERQAEIRRQEWLAAEERRRREEDRRRIKESIVQSQADLKETINRWADVMSIECFFAGVEERARDLPDAEQRRILGRLTLARSFLGSLDPLDFFLEWKSPGERYAPRYPETDEACSAS